MNENSHNKLVVFDLNINWKQSGIEDLANNLNVFKLAKSVEEYQTIVFVTCSTFKETINLIKLNYIKSGYLVTDCGAIIYDIKRKKIIQKNFLNNDDIKIIFHHGLMMGFNVGFYTETQKYAFASNLITYWKNKKLLSKSFELITDYFQLDKIINQKDIILMSYTSSIQSSHELYNSLSFYNFKRFFDNENKTFSINVDSTTNYIYFSNLNVSKYNAVSTIMSITNMESINDVLYIAFSSCDVKCYIAFSNTLVNNHENLLEQLKSYKKPILLSDGIKNLDPKFGLTTNSFWKR